MRLGRVCRAWLHSRALSQRMPFSAGAGLFWRKFRISSLGYPQTVDRTDVFNPANLRAYSRNYSQSGRTNLARFQVIQRGDAMFHSGRRRLLLAWILQIACCTATAPAEARTYLGSGGTACAEYINIKQALPEAGQGIDLWLLGYVSGLNFMNYITKKIDLLENQKSGDVIGFIQGYCSTNPKKTLNNAANEYWINLLHQFRH